MEIDDNFQQNLASGPWAGNVRAMENAIERAMVRMGDKRVLTSADLELPNEVAPQPPSAPVAEPAPAQLNHEIKSLRDVEKHAIAEALSQCGGNIKKTAERLGIARNTLYRKLEEYHLLAEEVHC